MGSYPPAHMDLRGWAKVAFGATTAVRAAKGERPVSVQSSDVRGGTRGRAKRADCEPSRPHWVVRSNAVLHSARGLRPFVNTPPSTKPCVLRSDPNRVLGGRAAKVDSAAHLAPGEIESEPAEADLALDHRNGPPPQPSISTRAAGQPIRESGRLLRAPAQADSAAAPGTGRAFVDELNPSYLKGGHHLR